MKSLRVVLIGCVDSTEVALSTLLSLGDKGVSCAGLITRRMSHFNTDFVDLLPLANAKGVPFRAVEDCESDEQLVTWMREIAPDLTLVVGWSRLLGPALLSIPRVGTIGYHPAALPANRGRHPIVWALALGLTETASSFFLMGEGADDGPVMNQQKVTIDIEDDARTLYDKLLAIMPMQISQIVDGLMSGKLKGVPQDRRLANYWRKRSVEDGRIDWRMSAVSIYNLVRALGPPYPGAHLMYQGRQVKVWKCRAEPANAKNIEPGKILNADDGTLLVKAGEGAIRLLDTDPFVPPKEGDYL